MPAAERVDRLESWRTLPGPEKTIWKAPPFPDCGNCVF
jgi:hypothetical protein